MSEFMLMKNISFKSWFLISSLLGFGTSLPSAATQHHKVEFAIFPASLFSKKVYRRWLLFLTLKLHTWVKSPMSEITYAWSNLCGKILSLFFIIDIELICIYYGVIVYVTFDKLGFWRILSISPKLLNLLALLPFVILPYFPINIL